MSIGNRLIFRVPANQGVTDTTLVDATGLSTSIAANQICSMDFWLPFSVGAAGGLKFQIVGPAAPSNVITQIEIFDMVTPAIIGALQTSSTPFSNALAVAGSHILWIRSEWKNGANAGTLKLQIAQNSNNATPFTLLLGGRLDCIKL